MRKPVKPEAKGTKTDTTTILPGLDSEAKPVNPDAARRAKLALQRFNKRSVMWNTFARTMTNDPLVRVVATAGTPCTDGKTIYLRVPIELGDDLHHGPRSQCGGRDADDRAICPACEVDEQIMGVLFHEMAHIVFNTFSKVSEDKMRDAIRRSLLEMASGGATTADQAARALVLRRKLETWKPTSYLDVANLISPFLPMIVNALEDVRVNEMMFSVRPGLRPMFNSFTLDVFERGLADLDGTIRKWTDMPENGQAIIGLFCKAAGYNYGGWFAPNVEAFLDAEATGKLVYEFSAVRTVEDVYEYAFPTLELLREYGFCKSRTDEGSSDEGEPGKGESGGGEPGESEESGDDDEPSDGESYDEPGKGGGEGKPDPGADDDDDEGYEPGGTAGDDDESDGDGADDGTGGSGDDGPGYGADDDEPREPEALEDGAGHGISGTDSAESKDQIEPSDTEDTVSDTPSSPSSDMTSTTSGSGDPMSDGALETPDEDRFEDEMGTPDEVQDLLDKFGGHKETGTDPGEHPIEDQPTDFEEVEAMNKAIGQQEWDSESEGLDGLVVREAGTSGDPYDRYDESGKTMVPESLLARSLLRMRIAFEDNAKAAKRENLKYGKVNAKVLARRVPFNDPRCFYKKQEPGRRDYFVVLGLDVSGSTRGNNIRVIKAAAMAQAELLHRMGVRFAVYAHSGGTSNIGTALIIETIKTPEQPWDDKARTRLQKIHPIAMNLDGHTMEFYRKVCDRQTETDKVIMYYTDGAMPAENYAEELVTLRREIKTIQQKGYTLVGVGIGNAEPKKYGLDTVVVNNINDVPKVIEFLRTKLMETLRRRGKAA